MAAADAVEAGHRTVLQISAEGEDGASVRTDLEVVAVDPALDLSGLIGAFESAGDDVAVLGDGEGLEGAAGFFDVVGVDGPGAGEVDWSLVQHGLLGA